MQKFILILTIIVSTQSFAAKFYYNKNFLTYYTTDDFQIKNVNIKRLVIIVHGALRNGDEYFTAAVNASKKHGVRKNTMIVAPHFRRESDQREQEEIYYGNRWDTKWKYGYKSQDSDSVSSFTLIDTLIKQISSSGSFPNLENIIVTGHSAGGQFTQRYAIGSTIREEIDKKISFVPSNPSSYMYLDSERFHFKDGNYSVIDTGESCPEFNEYIYGPIHRADYLAKTSVKDLKLNYKANRIIYLMSEEDTGTDMLDRSCEAMLQGRNRFERAKNFWHYDKKLIGGTSNHKFFGIAGAGHEYINVYESTEAAEVVFGLKTIKRQSYLYNKIGQSRNVVSQPDKLYLLLGGGKNERHGFVSFLDAANGGDVVVISAKSELFHRYTHDLWNIAKESNIDLDSVETISFLNRDAGSDDFIIRKIKNAEAIFFTGGDQSKYLNRIKGTKAHTAIIEKVKNGFPFAGTSAGLAIMGEYIFSAKYGGLTSRYVLLNPHADEVAIEKGFLGADLLGDLITDTHFTQRKRAGRLMGFMFRAQYDYKLKSLYGVGVDEQSSLVISNKGMIARGGVHLYKNVNSSISVKQPGPLSYGPLKHLRLETNITYPHYKLLDLTEGDGVVISNGTIK
jgi:cyanophycinase